MNCQTCNFSIQKLDVHFRINSFKMFFIDRLEKILFHGKYPDHCEDSKYFTCKYEILNTCFDETGGKEFYFIITFNTFL